MSLHLCVLLWARPGAAEALTDYEDRVLALLPDHGARVIQRARHGGADPVEGGAHGEGQEDAPLEIHILEFPSQAALEEYMADERRVLLARARDAAIARTQVLRVDLA